MPRTPSTPPIVMLAPTLTLRTPALTLATIALMLAAGLGCPAKVPTPESEAAAGKSPAGVAVTDPEDPRVVRDSDDLYAVEDAPRPPPGSPALGAGKPDTSNGVCKLFSPKLPEPQCCPNETGFDAERIKQLCGHALYMGESLQQSCGYYFMPNMDGGVPAALRASKLSSKTVAEAVADHDLRLGHVLKQPSFASEPVPGVEGAMWSDHDGVHWAFLPGWSTVRMVSWTDDACPIAAMPEVLQLMAAAKEPPPNAPRPDLVPQARP